ncbi:hypothetical protein HDV05_008220 [Chytridiales sp. JEL 0842]|nr:hypothetical protein HDV05_008220 [Chytridiales sp. JEL 0842]
MMMWKRDAIRLAAACRQPSSARAFASKPKHSRIPTQLPEGTTIKTYKVDHDQHEARLDEFLSKHAGVRKSLARLKILNGEVDVVGSIHAPYVDLKPNGILFAGDVVRVLAPQSAAKTSAVKSPSAMNSKNVNTTGALILGRTREATTKVSDLFQKDDHAIQKKYWAVVLGHLKEPSGEIVSGIVQHGKPPNEKMTAIEWHDSDDLLIEIDNSLGIKKAVTSYTVLGSKQHVSVVELSPSTGRKHQLRVHCSQILKGDYKYGEGCPKQLRAAFGNLKTVPMHLHLKELSIKDWFGPGKSLTVNAPLPDHISKTFKGMGFNFDQI